MVKFVSLINWTNGIALLGFLPLLIDIFHKWRLYKKYEHLTWPEIIDFDFIKSFIIGVLILVCAIFQNNDSEKQQETLSKKVDDLKTENSAQNHKLDSIQDIINSKQTVIDRKQDLIDSKQNIIDQKQDEINAKNDNIYKLQGKIIDTTQMVARLALRNLQLQDELLRHANSSKSFPLLIAGITTLPKDKDTYEYGRENVTRLVFNLMNAGKYGLANIKVKYRTFDRRIVHATKEGQIGEYNLSGGESIEIKDSVIKASTMAVDYPRYYKFTITWKTYTYTLIINLPFNVSEKNMDSNSLRPRYYFNNREFKNMDDFTKAVLTKIN